MSVREADNTSRLNKINARRALESQDYGNAQASSPRDDHVETQVDESFGQQRAFSLNDEGASEGDGSTEEALKYLQGVHSQAESESTIYFMKRDISKEESLDDSFKRHLKETTGELSVRHDEGLKKEAMDVEDRLTENAFILNNEEYTKWRQSLLNSFLRLKEEIAEIPRPEIGAISEEMEFPKTASEWRKVVMESEPPSINFCISNLDHPTVVKLIIYFTKWLSLSVNENFSKWIWMVFLRLDNLLSSEEQSTVRNLGKKALKLAKKVGDTENVTSISKYTVYMTLSIVTEYYRQRDLMNYEASK